MIGSPPISGVIYKEEVLRCGSCQTVYRPGLPPDAGEDRYDAGATAMVPILKYAAALPLYRLSKLQKHFGVPVPVGTLWGLVERMADAARPVYQELIIQAASAAVLYSDDSHAKILSLMAEIRSIRESGSKARTGVHCTCIIAERQGGPRIVLYMISRKHAGENMDRVLSNRPADAEEPLQMSDAEAKNTPKSHNTKRCYCLAHAKRKLDDVAPAYPKKAAVVLDCLKQTYRNDHATDEMSAHERLEYHKKHSAPILDTLKVQLDRWFDERLVEPNSSLGRVITYMTKRWSAFTRFTQEPGAPLDNNIVERALNLFVLGRKNFYFFKNEKGAEVGALHYTCIGTCIAVGVNPYHYYVALYTHRDKVKAAPAKWLPWNYKATLDSS